MTVPDPHPVVFYDGHCRLCSGTVRILYWLDRRKVFRFASLQGRYAGRRLSEAGLINPSGDSLILLYKNSIHSESSAALLILRILGLPWSILYGLIIVPRFIRDAAYRLIAKNRYRWFGKREACWLPGTGSANQFPDLVENGFDRAD